MEINEIWDKICKIYEISKKYIIEAEETRKDFKTFLQPVNEIKNAHEHMIRAKTSEIGMREYKEDYIRENLRCALGHEYRAFFDIADFYSITLRERIDEYLDPFSTEAIKTCIPEYYTQYRTKIYQITEAITEFRNSKDIGDSVELLPRVEEYDKLLEELSEIYKAVYLGYNSLVEYQDKRKKEEKKKKNRDALLTVVITVASTLVVGILLLKITPWFNKDSNLTEKTPPIEQNE